MRPFTIWTLDFYVLACKSWWELKELPKIYDMEDWLIEYDTQHRLKIYWIMSETQHECTYLIT